MKSSHHEEEIEARDEREEGGQHNGNVQNLATNEGEEQGADPGSDEGQAGGQHQGWHHQGWRAEATSSVQIHQDVDSPDHLDQAPEFQRKHQTFALFVHSVHRQAFSARLHHMWLVSFIMASENNSQDPRGGQLRQHCTNYYAVVL